MLIQAGKPWRRFVRSVFSPVDAFRALLAGRNHRLRRPARRPSAPLEMLESRMLLSAVVTTDQSDYAPGSTAVFTATSDGGLENNFQVGEAVQFQVVRTDGFPDFAPGNAPWIVTDGQGDFTPYENADGTWTYPDTDNLADGNIGTTWYVDAQYAGAWLQLRATGLSSGEVATADFTDSSIGTPTGIGTAANTTSGSSIGVTLTAPVTVGNTVLLAIAIDPSSTTVTVSDTAGNTYSKDADVSNNGGSSTSGVRTLIFSAPVTSALASGNVITVTFGANVTAKAVSAFSISGLVANSSAKDQVATSTGNNTSPNSGNTSAATTQTHELLFNAIGDEDRTVTFTAGSNLTALTQASVSGGAAASSMTVLPQFRIVTSKGTYSTAGTTDNSARWASALVTYKAALSTVTTLTSSSSTSTYGNSVTFTATVTTSAPATETPTGSVEFFDGAVSLGMGTALSGSGTAVTSTLTTSGLSTGTHSSIRAVFTGTGSFTTSTSSNRSQVVNLRPITITAAPVTKTYDGTTSTNATPSLTTGSLASGQTATYSESFADRNAGNSKNLIPDVVIRDGNNVDVTANYDVTKVNATGTIERKALTVSGLTVLDHVYDGQTDAEISGTPAFLAAELVGTGTTTDGRPYAVDTVTPGGSAAGVFSDANAGSDKSVMISGISVSGSGNGNYIVTQPAGLTGNITQRALTVTAHASNKTYDGSAAANVTLSDDRLSGDVFTVGYSSASFSNKNAGNGKAVTVAGLTLAGTDAGNYALVSTTASNTANISSRTLTVSAIAKDKVYDGETAASVTLSDDRVAGDSLTISSEAANFNSPGAGTGKAVNVTGIAVTGDDALNYKLSSTSAQTTAGIAARHVTGSFTVNDKTYDGTVAASIASRLPGNTVSGDDVSLTGGVATFGDKDAGTGKTVTLAGASLEGSDADNYILDNVSNASADITRRELTVTFAGVDKEYDGTRDATVILSDDRLAGDDLAAAYVAKFSDKNAGVDKVVAVSEITLSGTDAGNYTSNATAETSAAIAVRTLHVAATAQDKDYDGTVVAQVTLTDDRLAGDELSVTATAATFADPEVGTDKLVTVTGIGLGGPDAGNYLLANGTVTTLADISNLAPVLLQSSIGTTYHENALPVIISSEAIVTDGTPSLAGGQITISITANGTPDDRLGITNSGKLPGVIGLVGNSVLYSNTVIGSFAGGTGLAPLVITLNENATTVSAQALLQSIHFSVVGDNPSALQRAILFELNDGHGGTSEPVTSFVDIVLLNDAPDIVTAAGTTTYVESQSPVVIDGQITVSDVDSTDFDGGSLSVSIPLNSASTDVLSIRDEGSLAGQIGVSGNTVTFGGTVIGTVTGGQRSPLVIALNAAADAAATQALARNIQFSNTSTADSSQTRTIRFVLRDGDGGTSGTADREVAFQRNVQAPVINAPATLATYRENAPGVGISGQYTVTDADKPASFNNGVLTVDVMTNGSPSDQLSVRHEGLDAGQIGRNGDTVLYSNVAIGTTHGGTGVDPLVITLNENATLGATQALLRSITFANVSDAPSTAPRTIRFVLTDGAGGISTPVTSDVDVLAVNDDPMVTLSTGALNYTENDAATPVDSGITVTDDNVNLDGGQLIVDMPVNGTAKDRLEIRNEGTGSGQIGVAGDAVTFEGTVIGTFTGGTGTAALVVAFNANATPAAVQALARNITFCNVSDAPSTLPRSVKFIISDGSGGSSLAVTREVNVIAVNDAPVFNGIGGVGNYTENGTGIAVLSVATLSDPDLPANFGGGTLTVDFQANGIATDRLTIRSQGTAAGQIGVVGSDITYGNVIIGSFTGGVGEIPLVISLNAQATQAATQALVRNVMYSNISDNPLALTRTIRFVLSDGQGGISDAALKQVAVAAVNDASTITGLSSSVNYTEGSAAVLVAASSLVNDADSPDLNGGSLAVSLLAGAVAGDKLTIQSNDLISVAGNVVSYLGKQIGTFTGGSGTSPLIITFNTTGNATVEAVQALLQSIQFQALGTITANSTRTMKFVLKDGDGGTSLGYLETINVINV